MEPVDDEREELLRIMLSVTGEDWVDGSDCGFEVIGRESVFRVAVHSFDELGIALGEFSLGSKRVFLVDLVFIVGPQEVFSQGNRIGETL
jgi:hypothetical protein